MTEPLPDTLTWERLREMQCLARFMRQAPLCPPSPHTTSMLNFLIPPTHPRTLAAGGRDGQLREGLLGWGSWSLPVPPFHFLSAFMHLVSLTRFVPTPLSSPCCR
jgi:hypothetical protein